MASSGPQAPAAIAIDDIFRKLRRCILSHSWNLVSRPNSAACAFGTIQRASFNTFVAVWADTERWPFRDAVPSLTSPPIGVAFWLTATPIFSSTESGKLEEKLYSKPHVALVYWPADSGGTRDLTKAVEISDIAVSIVLHA